MSRNIFVIRMAKQGKQRAKGGRRKAVGGRQKAEGRRRKESGCRAQGTERRACQKFNDSSAQEGIFVE